MNNEKIDHHFNELSPIHFNIFQDTSLYRKLKQEGMDYELAHDLLDHIMAIKTQLASLVDGEDEQLSTVYGFLTLEEQKYYLKFLNRIAEETKQYIEEY